MEKLNKIDKRVKNGFNEGSKKTQFQKGHPNTSGSFKVGHIGFKNKGMLGKQHTEETRRKMCFSNKRTEETKAKMRLSAFEYAKKIREIICPRIGHNEKQILDRLEQELGYKILRQHKVEGYFIDGYIPELNLAVEVDERPKNREKDIERQKIIEEKLNCKFLRIKDFD